MIQHIASRDALEATNQHLLEVSEPLSGVGLAALGSDLDGVSDLLLVQVSLRRTLSENTLSPDVRAGIVERLLAGKIGAPALDVVAFAVRQKWSSSRDLMTLTGRLTCCATGAASTA